MPDEARLVVFVLHHLFDLLRAVPLAGPEFDFLLSRQRVELEVVNVFSQIVVFETDKGRRLREPVHP